MFTTAGLRRSTTSAKLTREPIAGAPGLRGGTGRAADIFAGAPAATADRATPPATIAPTRNATTAGSVMVTMVKRRDMNISGLLSISAQERQKPSLVHPLASNPFRLL